MSSRHGVEKQGGRADIAYESSDVNMECSDDEESHIPGMSNESDATTNTSRFNIVPSHQSRGRKSKKSGKGKSRKQKNYSYTGYAKEDHGQPLYGCDFYQNSRPDEPLIFATVGSNRVTIYECLRDGSGSIKLLQCFEDPDPKEEFYTCAWSHEENGQPLLAAAGSRGIIRIFSLVSASCVKHYMGHGQAINDLMFHPKDKNLLLSSSKDHSLRLWNVKTNICVAVFGGVDGHTDQVIAADIDITGSRMVSCGMDHSLKVWMLKKPEIQKAIQHSYTFIPSGNLPFPTMKQNFPDFSTRDIHRNYVDCAKWFGDFIFSKSLDDIIVCWKAGKPSRKWDEVSYTCTETLIITRLPVKDCDLWYIRFAMDLKQETLALGNKSGETFIYDLKVDDPSQIRVSVLSHPKCLKTIRQTAFSRDGRVLICVCDDATVWRWDKTKEIEGDIDK